METDKSIVDKNTLDTKTLNKDLEPFGFAYYPEQDIFYSIMNAWQRQYGYRKSYDEIAPLIGLIVDCEPICFEYDNKKWLIEFWKGQYGMTTGGEVGVYVADEQKNKDILSGEIVYESVTDQDRLPISFTLNKNGNALLTRSKEHWWLTGFKLGEFSEPSELTMDIVIKFKDGNMRNAFIKALRLLGYRKYEIQVINNSVYVTFYYPHTPQPRNEAPLVTKFAQERNKQNCDFYNSQTKDYDNALDKLNYIKKQLPEIYSRLLNIGGNDQVLSN